MNSLMPNKCCENGVGSPLNLHREGRGRACGGVAAHTQAACVCVTGGRILPPNGKKVEAQIIFYHSEDWSSADT